MHDALLLHSRKSSYKSANITAPLLKLTVVNCPVYWPLIDRLLISFQWALQGRLKCTLVLLLFFSNCFCNGFLPRKNLSSPLQF